MKAWIATNKSGFRVLFLEIPYKSIKYGVWVGGSIFLSETAISQYTECANQTWDDEPIEIFLQEILNMDFNIINKER